MPSVCTMVGRAVDTMVISRASMSLLAARAATMAQKRSPLAGAAATDSFVSIVELGRASSDKSVNPVGSVGSVQSVEVSAVFRVPGSKGPPDGACCNIANATQR
ncbi:hypothetical protein CH063_14128 [Colletotrichum higginsianum]|uniref:Uncharacterized protein n=1 Tax=Colletotrichum higginsianum (strain IMI 349063) TaxID=759273 RepID=H1VXA7_COLHI|nr:hypothetical protein CH063_14128 [Colletotrichum higginsianum]